MVRTLFVSLLLAIPVSAQRQPEWFASWSAANHAGTIPHDSSGQRPAYFDVTLRQIVRATIAGEYVRIRLSNEYGERSLLIGAAHIAVRDSGPAIRPGTDRALTFGGQSSVAVRPGATVTSDPVSLTFQPLADLAISLWIRDTVGTLTHHPGARETSFISRSGDKTAAASFSSDSTHSQWLWLAGVDVKSTTASGVIVAIGNSLTDGAGARVGTNGRWPDVLARRLIASKEAAKGVVNAGISGNRLLTPTNSPSVLARFDRDVLMQPGVSHVVVLVGINDLRRGTATADPRDSISVAEIVYAYQQLIARAHDKGITIIGATLNPIGGNDLTTPAVEAKRQAVNRWIRTSRQFDGVIDFDAATRDPANPFRLLTAFDSGDHLHLNETGYKAMGDAIDLALFRQKRTNRPTTPNTR